MNEFSSKGLCEYESSQTSVCIELTNISSNDLTIPDYYISDKKYNLFKWRLPNEIISPSQETLILCSGKDKSERIKNWSSLLMNHINGVTFRVHQSPIVLGIQIIILIHHGNQVMVSFGDHDDSTTIKGQGCLKVTKPRQY